MVARQLLLNRKPLCPGDIAFMTLRQQNIPLLRNRTQRRAVADTATETVGIATAHRRMLENAQNTIIRCRPPCDLRVGMGAEGQRFACLPYQRGRLSRRAGLPKSRKHRQDRGLNALVGILADAVAIADKPDRRPKIQRTAKRLVPPSTLHPRPQDRGFRGREGALNSQNKAIVVPARSINLAVFNQEHIMDAAQMEKLKPFDRVAGKPRDLDPEHAADQIPCKQLAQRPEALARAKRIFARSLPKIRINEPDTMLAPAQFQRTFVQGVLARRRFPVPEHLFR